LIRLFFGFLVFAGSHLQAVAKIFLLLIRVRFAFDPLLIRCWFGVGSIWSVDLQGRFVSVRFWFDFEPGGGRGILDRINKINRILGVGVMMLVYMVGPFVWRLKATRVRDGGWRLRLIPVEGCQV
jgi:hypothetical protein